MVNNCPALPEMTHGIKALLGKELPPTLNMTQDLHNMALIVVVSSNPINSSN